MGALDFIKTHLYVLAVPVILLAVMYCLHSKKKKALRKFQEMSQIKQRDEALNEALRNPQVKEARGGPERPMEIQWDDKAVREKGKKGESRMAELVELSAYSRRRYVYRMDQPIRIGSGKENQMELPRDGVAEAHCEIFLQGGRACVRTLPGAKTLLKRGKESALISANGIYLKNGDHIQLGSAEIQFRMFKA